MGRGLPSCLACHSLNAISWSIASRSVAVSATCFRSAMLSPTRQRPAVGLRLVLADLAQVSLPHLERGALLRQPFVMVIDFVDVAVGMGEHGKAVVTGDAKPRQSGRDCSSEVVRRRPIGFETRHRLGIVT